MIDLAAAILILGASNSAMPYSPCHLLAERIGAPVEVRAYSGAKLHQVMPNDTMIREAAMVCSVDGFYWYNGLKPDCDEAISTAEHLFTTRAGKPMILGTVPWNSGCAYRINPLLKERCKEACILLRFDETLVPAKLHPGPEFMRQVVGNVYKLP